MRKPARAEGASARGDSRVAVFRDALEGLVESLDATVRVEGWRDAEPVPDPLKSTASQLAARLGTANRLAAGRFSGSTADATRVRAIGDAVRRLDAAYVAYRRTTDRTVAAGTLNAAIVEIRASV